jgi:membrane protease YdiL (CAAX protease family)
LENPTASAGDGSSATEPQRISLGRRILIFPLTRIVVATVFVLLPALLVQAAVRALQIPKPLQMPLMAVVVVPMTVLALRAYKRFVERRPLDEFAPHGAAPECGAGVLLGAGLFAAVAGVLTLRQAFVVTGGHRPGEVLPNAVAMAALSSVTEEVLMRGVIFRICEEALGSWGALVVSAMLFGLGHIFNPGATVWSAAAIAIEAGVLLGAAYMLTRRLWLPIGLHAGWNFTEAGVFGAATSGNELPGLLESRTVGPTIISGGTFGAEGSIVAVVLCAIAGVALITLAARRGRVVPAPWRRHAARS